MNIYLIDNFSDIDNKILNGSINRLPVQRRNYNNTLKTEKGKLYNVLSFNLLKYVFLKEKNLVLENNTEFIFGKKGKPYLKGLKTDFSFSHSDAGIVCALNDGIDTVGVDIERKGKFFAKIALRVCCEEEMLLFSQSPENKKADLFYEMWVKKEAYSKMTGNGFSEGFNKINTLSTEYNRAELLSVKGVGFFIGISVIGGINSLNIIKADAAEVLHQL